jgi:hypothetical protein
MEMEKILRTVIALFVPCLWAGAMELVSAWARRNGPRP